MQLAVAHQDAAGVVGHLAPFVEIEGDRVGALDARASSGASRGRQHASAPNAPSTWNQSSSRGAERGERGEIVDRADIDGAGGADDQERLSAPGRAVGGDGARRARDRSIAKSLFVGMRRSAALPMPAMSIACATQPWAAAEA